MPASKAQGDALAALKGLIQSAKQLDSDVSELAKLALANQKAMTKLKTAVDSIKPPPDKNAKLAEIKNLDKKIREDAMTAHYNVCKKLEYVNDGLSKTGQQRSMLNNLISMTNICVEQHTGGKSGEAYQTRSNNRLITLALKGLSEDQKHLDKVGDHTSKTAVPKGTYDAKSLKTAELNLVSKQAYSLVKSMKEIEGSVRDYIDGISGNAKTLMAGFAETNAA